MSDLPPGPELDALVAEKVMGWERAYTESGPAPFPYMGVGAETDRWFGNAWYDEEGMFQGWADDLEIPGYVLPSGRWSPSTDIRAAMEVVERLVGDGASFDLEINPSAYPQRAVWANFRINEPQGGPLHDGRGKTVRDLPHAICLAALKAVEGK